MAGTRSPPGVRRRRPPARPVRRRPARAARRMALEAGDLFLDYSKHRVTDETLALLLALAERGRPARADRRDVPRASGSTSPRTAPRSTSRCARPRDAVIEVDGDDVVAGGPRGARPDGRLHRSRARRAVDRRSPAGGSATSSTSASAAATSVPRWRTRRCGTSPTVRMTFRFVSNVDGTDIAEATRDLDPPRRCSSSRSKTFTTLETLTNAGSAARRGSSRRSATTRPSRSTSWRCRRTRRRWPQFGIDTANMFGFWDWVGGRYSMDSAIGLSLMIAIGPEHFREMLAGFHDDGRALPHRAVRAEHAGAAWRSSGIWYGDFLGAQTHAVLPYSQHLAQLPRVPPAARHGERTASRWTSTATRSTIRPARSCGAQPGTNGQHAYYQLIHQGTKLIPADFIGFARAEPRRRPITTTC